MFCTLRKAFNEIPKLQPILYRVSSSLHTTVIMQNPAAGQKAGPKVAVVSKTVSKYLVQVIAFVKICIFSEKF